ncbi:MAG: ABC transporter ATP-binding protein [Sphingomonadales bacterium]|nr:ABC transporter ATP-binding protein [Sphingomonadales bacterium]
MRGFPSHVLWPRHRLGEALATLGGGEGGIAGVPPEAAGPRAAWIAWAAATAGVEAVPVSATPRELPGLLGAPGAVLVDAGAGGFVLLHGAGGGRVRCDGPDGGTARLTVRDVAALLAAPLAAAVRPEVDRVIGVAGIAAAARRETVAAALVAERIGAEDIGGLWLLRAPPGAALREQVAAAGLGARFGRVIVLLSLLYGGEAWGWSLIGGATLSGRVDPGWMAAWLLLLFTLLPLRLLAGWHEAMFALDGGRLVKSRLLAGAMALPLDLVRRSGVGSLVGRVMESQALEALAMGGGFAVLVGLIELALAGWVLGHGAAPRGHGLLLAGFAVLTALGAAGFHRAVAAWSRRRLGLTHALIEAMVGHRTRLAQERAERRDREEDARLADYHAGARALDTATVRLGNDLPLAWNAAAIAVLAPGLAGAGSAPPAAIAISFAGIVLAGRALGAIGQGLAALSQARFAWGRIATIFQAAARPERPGLAPGDAARDGAAMEAQGLHFAHPGGRAVLAGADLRLDSGDRVLVEGPSGGGKSTLAALLTGQRQPDSGLLLLDGLDRPTLGDDWHRRVASAPQFHENHVFSGTLAFNLLLGREWPPRPADLAEAEALCRELGLGGLIDRMPGGLQQRVGETGWQLSHGERSRIFLARALLQQADITVLDESFGALDPATMEQCLAATLQRARTLVVIAHP